VRLDSGQLSTGRPSLELDIHVFDAEGPGAEGGWNYVRHTLATFLFDGIEALELGGFGHQNVLDDLLFEDIDDTTAGVSGIAVSAPSNWGLSGTFRCEGVTVLHAAPLEPGPHSAYRADG